jgi:hypothetical protein
VFRPTPGLGRPETPIRGLYLASASAHPGGGVHGGPGANAARAALLGPLGRRAVWAANDLVIAPRPGAHPSSDVAWGDLFSVNARPYVRGWP